MTFDSGGAHEQRAAARAPRTSHGGTRPIARATKRLVDVVVAALALLILAPFLVVVAIAIRLSSPGPVLFRQQRAGMHGRTFTLLKFRTMRREPNARGAETSKDDPRVFPVGRILREYHIDEIPQLLNVLAGDMSLVGPRPTVPSQVATYTDEQRERLLVRPGLTGLAQVSGNNLLDWAARIEVDRRYVRTQSLWLDITIMARTAGVVVRKHGVYGNDGWVRDKE